MSLRELIQFRGTSQAQLAAALGVSQAMVSKWVSGKRRPKLETVWRLAEALDAEPIPETDGWDFNPLPDKE